MKKISICGAAACLLLGLASAHAADMSQDGMKKSNMEMKSGTMQKDSMDKNAMPDMSKSDAMMHKNDTMQKSMPGGAMDKGTMQK